MAPVVKWAYCLGVWCGSGKGGTERLPSGY